MPPSQYAANLPVTDQNPRHTLRLQNLPQPTYPSDLPVVACREELLAAIDRHQVVVVCGETGSGKTTQLPKLCLELQRGVRGFIGHTQPRRLAARSVAGRIAEELQSPLGQYVGYKVRFQDHCPPDSYIKLMTDGILLAEIQHDRYLKQYDTLIIDEAHERSLNIDFLLGYLKWLLPKRRDLKLIITSATIDPERFARHFDNAPIIHVPGRTYPVETRYRPLIDPDSTDELDRDLTQAIVDAVDELGREGRGDILVFLPGEREIRETAEALRKHHLPATEVLPLYARLPQEEQHRIFESHAQRRIVLATNVAETSLTVPGIRYVIDTGYARIARYAWRGGVRRLPIEKISQAAANQRAGRCGRVAPGIAIRLYSEDDFNSRPAFTEPEILRTDLAAVILQLATLWQGDLSTFPFLEPPDPRQVREGYKVLHELGAMDGQQRLTPLGKQLAKLPLDPRLGRMLLAAQENGALREVLVIASALAIQDPRERPLEHQQAADEKHARFKVAYSDFLGFLKLWEYYHEQRRHLSQRKLRALCQQEYLSYVRLREWHDIHSQLQQQLHELGYTENTEAADYAAIHRSLLAGLLSHIGQKSEERGEYTGANGRKFQLFPASYLKHKTPAWLVAAELVETSRLYARTAAKIEPEWLEELAPHLLRRHYSEPHWEQRAGYVAAFERVTLYGLTIVPRRKVNYSRIDPALCRELLIRHALVYGEYRCTAPFCRHNAALLAEVEELEAKARRRDILVDEQQLYAFYDQRLPADITNAAAFERWRQQAERSNPKVLFLSLTDLMQRDASVERSAQFPDELEVNGMRLPLQYTFDPQAEEDGITVILPTFGLNQLPAARFTYLVPGMLEEKITALLRALPKALRKHVVPIPDYARACAAAIAPSDSVPLQEALATHLKRMNGHDIPATAWTGVELPRHLLMRFVVRDENGANLATGRDWETLKAALQGRTRQALAKPTMQPLERDGITRWDFGDLPEAYRLDNGSGLCTWPALVDQGKHVAIRLFDHPAVAAAHHADGVLRLLLLTLAGEARELPRHMPDMTAMCLHYASLSPCEELKGKVVRHIVRQTFAPYLQVRSQTAFQQAVQAGRPQLFRQAQASSRLLAPIFALQYAIRQQLKASPTHPVWQAAVADITDQLAHLLPPDFLDTTPITALQHFPRYLKGIQRRLEKLAANPAKDAPAYAAVAPLWERWKAQHQAMASTLPDPDRQQRLQDLHWLLEELRVSLFAQELGTARPISVKRFEEAWNQALR